MCGIAGIVHLLPSHPVLTDDLLRMLAMIRHRGPDEFGFFCDDQAGIANARLSIIDLTSGQQPISNEDQTLWIVYNGEVFNYLELRRELMNRGHLFSTHSDTEVILHLYEECGPACLEQLNGQFAIAIWDAAHRTLFLARDRLGVRPLFYTLINGKLVFASEIKAILSHPAVRAELDPVALHEIFTFWSPLSPHTVFKDIYQVPPAHYLLCQDGAVVLHPYWQLTFPSDSPENAPVRLIANHLDEFRALLINATQIRLRADVPVGAYLSGGLDSSTLAAIIRRETPNRLETFSITFSDPAYDESAYQRQMADFLGTEHHLLHATHARIGEVFPQVIWHSEVPILRTAPAPMFMLSQLVHDHHFKVVMTGEGADEFLAGYDLFKEDRIRQFWSQAPDSTIRSRLLAKLYPDIQALTQTSQSFRLAFFRQRLAETGRSDYSHYLRWHTTSRALRFFSADLRRAAPAWEQQLEAHAESLGIPLPAGFMHWHPLSRAQYLEITIFLSQYLLSSQGDRMAMAHAVEGRYPFLDHRLVEFCNRLPPNLKLRGLAEKYLLKQLARQWLPSEITRRSKRPYRAPIQRCFYPTDAPIPPYVTELLSPAQLKSAGYFNPEAVSKLVAKIRQGAALGETDNMALVGILSTQLAHQLFITAFQPAPRFTDLTQVKMVIRRKNQA